MRVLTFSRFFPAYHPRKGEPTHFVEGIWKSLDKLKLTGDELDSCINEYYKSMGELHPYNDTKGKYHTIRAGNRWKAGDWFSPRVWSDKPYRSKQLEFAPPIQIKKVWSLTIEPHKEYGFAIHINGSYVSNWVFKTANTHINDLARNDGLTKEDLISWFKCDKKKPVHFNGQIICWHNNIEYY